jgi:pimeloyl-ACP methyl ester carboxylesterase
MLLLSLLASLWFAQPAAPGLEGLWQGTLAAGPAKLRLVLRIVRSPDGRLSGTMDSVDQGAKGLPMSSITLENGAVRFAILSIGGEYQGTLGKGGSEMSGEWKQGGASLPLSFQRTDKPPELKRPQEPSGTRPYQEQEVVYENRKAGVKLTGALTLPPGKGPFPVVLLLSGSGPQDRNETVAGHRPFLVLADYLTRGGIAVLRTDDRGVGNSGGDLRAATLEDFASDALAGIEFLKQHKEIDSRRIGLIGHSEGGQTAALAASRSSDVAFVVLLATPALPGEQILFRQAELIAEAMGAPHEAVDQNRQMQERVFAIVKQEKDPAVIEKKIRALVDPTLAQLDASQRKAAEAAMAGQIAMARSAWFRFLLTYDPAATLAKVRQPVLATTGELDLQAPPDDSLPVIEKTLKAAGNKDVQVVKLPGLNHLFQTARTGTPLEYATLEETFAPSALKLIGDWITQKTAR